MSVVKYCRNPKITIEPFHYHWRGTQPDDAIKANELEDVIRAIKRHVDDLGDIRVTWDEGKECLFGQAEWEFGNYEYQDGVVWPLCCTEAQEEAILSNPEWMPTAEDIAEYAEEVRSR